MRGLYRMERGRARAARGGARRSRTSSWRPARTRCPASLSLGIRQRLQLARGVPARARSADSRRADLGRRSRRPRHVLAHADRSLARRGRDDLRHHPLHERGGALRPHLAHARGPGAGGRRAARTSSRSAAATSLEDCFVGYLAEAAGIDRTKTVEAPLRREAVESRHRAARAAEALQSRRASGPTPAARRSSFCAIRSGSPSPSLGPIILMLAFGYRHFVRHRKPADGGVRPGPDAAKPRAASRASRARATSPCSRRSPPTRRRSGA